MTQHVPNAKCIFHSGESNPVPERNGMECRILYKMNGKTWDWMVEFTLDRSHIPVTTAELQNVSSDWESAALMATGGDYYES